MAVAAVILVVSSQGHHATTSQAEKIQAADYSVRSLTVAAPSLFLLCAIGMGPSGEEQQVGDPRSDQSAPKANRTLVENEQAWCKHRCLWGQTGSHSHCHTF